MSGDGSEFNEPRDVWRPGWLMLDDPTRVPTPEETASANKWLREKLPSRNAEPIPMLLYCPMCGKRHIDEGEFATKSHHTHACQKCGNVWRPSILATVGVPFLPGLKNKTTDG